MRKYRQKKAYLTVDGKRIKCKSWNGGGSGKVKGELYILEAGDEVSLSFCRDKIVLCQSVFKDMYNILYRNGAKAIITHSGDYYLPNRDIDTRTLGNQKDENNSLPIVSINIKDAYDIVKNGGKSAELDVEIFEGRGQSQNVVLDIKGETDEVVLACAHYDSTHLSKGVFDNMSSCVALLYLADYFKGKKLKRTLRLVWCGSEETGLVGSRAYCKYNSQELEKVVLNINLDMLGCVMGAFTCFSCVNEDMEQYMKKLCLDEKFPATVKLAIRSSDSNSFVHNGVPAVSFARYGAGDTGLIHTRYDNIDSVSVQKLLYDSRFVALFTEEAVNNSKDFPQNLVICDKIKTDVDNYMKNKLEVL